ncbi:hypothetical protein GCM10011491_43690 [Brucella endophytica]|uniref:Uncharacterized protein n=1 Tax=Brucella endophytica TaxID=1963359 RepID=A0A916WM09_9HYPH|nr:hypothetical protein GCM10011491_43690 [Brucella endophytica]
MGSSTDSSTPCLCAGMGSAFQLARTLMVPVTLVRSGNELGVLPSAEIDGDEVDAIAEFDPFEYGPDH